MTEEELSKWATKLIQRFDNTKIIGSGGEWSGSTRQGFMFNPKPKGPSSGTAPPPPENTGACCYDDGTCAVVTQAICEDGGGTYQGDGTTCDPNPCGCSCNITTFDISLTAHCFGSGWSAIWSDSVNWTEVYECEPLAEFCTTHDLGGGLTAAVCLKRPSEDLVTPWLFRGQILPFCDGVGGFSQNLTDPIDGTYTYHLSDGFGGTEDWTITISCT